MVLKSEKMPEDWQLGQIFNIFKKGEPEDRGNYRGITLLSHRQDGDQGDGR